LDGGSRIIDGEPSIHYLHNLVGCSPSASYTRIDDCVSHGIFLSNNRQKVSSEMKFCGAVDHISSVSVDPAVDTPDRLKPWAGKFGAQPGWKLVTGSKAAIRRLRM
jgi:hypothetical protein